MISIHNNITSWITLFCDKPNTNLVVKLYAIYHYSVYFWCLLHFLGGHSVGESDPLVSGFEGEWDLTPTILDNGYFLAMVNTVNWQQSENKPIAEYVL